MSTSPLRPLPVGRVPAWLLGPLNCNLHPFSLLTPCRLQYGAEMTRQGKSPTPHISLSPQPWPLATVPALSIPVNIASKVTEACSIAAQSSFRLLPVGGQKGSSPLTVSAPNRSKRGNCCSAWTPLAPQPAHREKLREPGPKSCSPLFSHGLTHQELRCSMGGTYNAEQQEEGQ